MDGSHEALVDFLGALHARPGGTGGILNLFRGAKVRAAADLNIMTDLVADPRLKLELAAHACDEARHAYRLLQRMDALGFRAFRLPEPLDRVDALLARSRARDIRHVYADRVAVSEAELMEVMVAASLAKEDSIAKLAANRDALVADRETRTLLAEILPDERRHLAYLSRWLERFEERFSRRAVARTRERLEAAFVEVNLRYYAALEDYFARAAA